MHSNIGETVAHQPSWLTYPLHYPALKSPGDFGFDARPLRRKLLRASPDVAHLYGANTRSFSRVLRGGRIVAARHFVLLMGQTVHRVLLLS